MAAVTAAAAEMWWVAKRKKNKKKKKTEKEGGRRKKKWRALECVRASDSRTVVIAADRTRREDGERLDSRMNGY